MITIVGVRFQKAGKISYFAPGELDLQLHDGVIVETTRGKEYGVVVIEPREVSKESVPSPIPYVLRKANEKDLRIIERNMQKAEKAYDIALEKIALHQLPMKLIDVEYTFDGHKILFFFTAEGRVDFRDLVKDLAHIFKTRIELRQIGVRDEAKMINSIGSCGRPLCCATFLGDFTPVSIKMAKEQNVSLNPTKISGVCGRLLCCLTYENEQYKKGGDLYVRRQQKIVTPVVAEPPGVGKQVVTDEGMGKVLRIDRKRQRVKVQLEEGRSIDLDWSEIERPCDE